MKRKKAFTLLEILIVVTVIGVIAAVIFVALDPGKRLKDSRNAARYQDVEALVDAINLYHIDNSGQTIPGITGSKRMVGTAESGCRAACDTPVGYLEPDDSGGFAFVPAALAAPSSGWVTPDSVSDPGNQWTNEIRAYDGNTGTYATNTYGGTGWGQFIVFDFASPITSDRLRLFPDYLDAHIQEADIDIYRNGAWVDVFQGGNESTWNGQWVELTFAKGDVEGARFRYNYKTGGYHYWLYEFQFYQGLENPVPPTCDTLPAGTVYSDSALLRADLVDDGGEPAEWRFVYGPTTSYGMATGWQSDGISGDLLQQAVSGLAGSTTYHYQAQVRNSAGQTGCGDAAFTTGAVNTGWVLPYGSSDPESAWLNEGASFDNHTGTFAYTYHNINAPLWSDWLYLDFVPTTADRLRFYARGLPEVNQVDVDVMSESAWQDVYQGSFADKTWVEKTFAEWQVDRVRIRFRSAYGNHGFNWELYELALYQSQASEIDYASTDECLDLSPYLVPEYLSEIPYDPRVGSPEMTYYAVKRENFTRKITVYACQAEETEIRISK